MLYYSVMLSFFIFLNINLILKLLIIEKLNIYILTLCLNMFHFRRKNIQNHMSFKNFYCWIYLCLNSFIYLHSKCSPPFSLPSKSFLPYAPPLLFWEDASPMYSQSPHNNTHYTIEVSLRWSIKSLHVHPLPLRLDKAVFSNIWDRGWCPWFWKLPVV